MRPDSESSRLETSSLKRRRFHYVGNGGYGDLDDSEYMHIEAKLWRDGLDSWSLDAIKER